MWDKGVNEIRMEGITKIEVGKIQMESDCQVIGHWYSREIILHFKNGTKCKLKMESSVKGGEGLELPTDKNPYRKALEECEKK